MPRLYIYRDGCVGMTEKRFKSILNDIGLRDEKTGKDYIYFNPEIVDLINNITSENEQLKQQINYLQSQLFDIRYDTRKRTLDEVKEEIKKLERYE